MSVGEAVTVIKDRRDAERGRRLHDEAGVVEKHPHIGGDRRLLDPDGVVCNHEEVSRTAGMGHRPAAPSAMVLVESVVTTRLWRHKCVNAVAPSGWTQITSTAGAKAFTT